MPKPKSHTKSKVKTLSKSITVTKNPRTFARMREERTDRLNVLSEGDSWFAYPPNWVFNSKPANLIDFISAWTGSKANFMRMESNGDEAVDILSGAQKHRLVDMIRWHETSKKGRPIDLLLFSGGGNDLVGENDFERFLRPYEKGFSAQQCVNMARLRRKSAQIGLAYHELADIRDHYSPQTVIMTHTYDYPYPSLTGAVLLGGLIKTQAWMKRFMDDPKIKIPAKLQADVVKIFMDEVGKVIREVGKERRKFIVVDTLKTLKGEKAWLNEIHPTKEGFHKLASKIWAEMKAKFPAL